MVWRLVRTAEWHLKEYASMQGDDVVRFELVSTAPCVLHAVANAPERLAPSICVSTVNVTKTLYPEGRECYGLRYVPLNPKP